MIHLNPYYRVAVVQLVIIGVFGGLVAILGSSNDAIALCLGGLIAIVAYVWFTFRTVSSTRVKASVAIVAGASRGVLEKYGLSALGFAAIFALYKPVGPLYVFCGYITALCIQIYAVGKISQQTKL